MSNSEPAAPLANAHPRKLSRDTVFLIGDLLPLCDFAGVLLAAWLATVIYARVVSANAMPVEIFGELGRAALAAALLAPFILCDRAFIAFASGGQTAALMRCYLVRFAMFAGVVAAIELGGRVLQNQARAWLVLWFAGSLLATALARMALVANLRRLERKGVLVETIAVVGAGAVADRLIRHLRQTRGDRVQILGVFDDRTDCRDGWVHKPAGSIDDLLLLGQSHPIDWVLLTLPASAESRLRALVHRLKALAVTIALCPQSVGRGLPCEEIRILGNGLPVTLLADRPGTGWRAISKAAEIVLPRWIVTLIGLPFAGLALLLLLLRQPAAQKHPLTFALDNYDLPRFAKIAARFGQRRFGYVVTPNADHLIRLHHDASFRALYADAAYVLLDSRFIARMLRFTRKLDLPVCTGADLTAELFDQVITPDDPLVLIGGSQEQAARLAAHYGLTQLAHFNPPMGFINDPDAVETCLRFVEAHSPFRYCLLAVGAPQQEILAQRLKARGVARGMALCIGASIDFLTGQEQRAPMWMQQRGLEWAFRLAQSPGRLAHRYLVRGPQLFGLLRRTQIMLRARLETAPRLPAVANASLVIKRRPAAASSSRMHGGTSSLVARSGARRATRNNESATAV